VTETPEQRVQRLQGELAQAKIDALQGELIQAEASLPGAPRQANRSWASAPPSDARLAPAPRSVPLGFRLVVLPWSWWTLFALLMITTAPIALWITFPPSGAVAAVVAAVAVLGFWLRKDARRLSLLRWGEVATVVSADLASVGTYYSGVTYQNVRLPQAHGWEVTRQWYSGPGTTTKITYELRGTRGELVLHGLPYDNGVILAHSKHPERALCVSSFPYELHRGADGNWASALPTRSLVGAIAMFVALAAWTAAMILLWR
jgi:hypothetical protein